MGITPNGTLLFVMLYSITLLIPIRQPIPVACTVLLVLFFYFYETNNKWASIRYAAITVGPILIMLIIMWCFIIGAPPNAIPTTHKYDRVGSIIYVLRLTTRLFLFVLLVHLTLSSKLGKTPIRFLNQLTLPIPAKQTIAMTLSIMSTIRTATERAWIALVASNIITPRRSLRNISHTWLFLQTIWTFMIATINEKMSSKWKVENMDVMLKDAFEKQKFKISIKDVLWIFLALFSMTLTIIFERQ